MAKVNLLGVQPLDFETKEGNTVKGIKLHVTYKDDNVFGEKCDTKFISAIACKNLGVTEEDLSELIGQTVEIETNFNGKIVGFSIA